MKTIFSSLIQALLQKHPILTPLVLACFLFGIGVGAISARNLDATVLGQAEALLLQPEGTVLSDLLLQTLMHTLLPLLLLFLFAWSAIGIPICLSLPILRGFSIGFAVCLTVRQWSNRGILLALAVFFPRMLAEIPAFLLFCIFSCGVSAGLFKTLFSRSEQGIKPLPYLLLFLFLILAGTLLGCGFEYLQQLFMTHFIP